MKRAVDEVIRAVAARLGNTAVCRACYVHPILIDRFLTGPLDREDRVYPSRRSHAGLTAEERDSQPESFGHASGNARLSGAATQLKP